MKIAKYLLLLALLCTITVSVFVATKDGKYAIKHTKIIDLSKEVVYKYVTDKKNWDSINPWKGENFIIKKTENTPSDSIVQNVVLNEVENKLKLELRDTLKNKTLAIWSTSGKLTFKDKFLSIIGRGTKNDFEDRFEEALNFINKTLTREINTFNIKVDGFVKRDTIFYIQRPIVSTKEQIPLMIKKYLPALEKIILSTNTQTNGSAFLIYHNKDSVANKFKYSIAIPTQKKVFISSDSDVIPGQINPSSIVKATVTGNYIHLNKAKTQLYEYMKTNKLEQSDKYKEIEIISKNPSNSKSASRWVTEILIPVRPIKLAVKPQSVKKDSTVSTTVTSPNSDKVTN